VGPKLFLWINRPKGAKSTFCDPAKSPTKKKLQFLDQIFFFPKSLAPNGLFFQLYYFFLGRTLILGLDIPSCGLPPFSSGTLAGIVGCNLDFSFTED
jgi:hypothetical protein